MQGLDGTHAVVFQEPASHRAKQGESVQAAAERLAVSPGELRAWNGLTADDLHDGQILLVWPSAEPPLRLANVLDDYELPAPTQAAVHRPALAPSAPARPRAQTRTYSRGQARRSAPPQDAPAAPAPAPVERQTRRIAATNTHSMRHAGALGALSGIANKHALNAGIDPSLAETVATLQVERIAPRTALSARGDSLGRIGVVEPSGPIGLTARPRATSQTNVVGTGSVAPKRLSLPARKRCLSSPGLDDLTADDQTLYAQSLSADQIRRSLNGFVRNTLACIPAGTRGSFHMRTEITVACSGRVADVRVTDRGNLPSNVTSCVAQTLRFASFPAHGLPDGATFEYPLQFRY